MASGLPELLLLCLLALPASAQDDSSLENITASGYDTDPILRYRPNFGRSLPTQILITGVVLTLVAVLLIHLLFTAQYHWKLAQANYILQMSAVLTLLTSLIASLKIILDNAVKASQQWPFMLDYIGVDLPPLMYGDDGWSTGGLAGWLFMNATTSALIQITHIQFLTLMYPSRLEARLIFALLGPLAIVAAVMQMIPVSSSNNLVSIAYAVRNVCNATLSLLFTTSLFLWGILINRKQAWRTDGGTAAFGTAALTLAVVSTALTLIYIPSKEQYDWLPPLTWAVMLWQSFLGWWWWVGAGMGVGEVEELLRREEKRRRRRTQREQRRREQREKARVLWRGVTEKFSHARPDADEQEKESDEERVEAASAASSVEGPQDGTLWRRTYAHLRRAFGYLRTAHLVAARQQAAARVDRLNDAYAAEGAHDVPDRTPSAHGWGLGSFGIREREAEDRREVGVEGPEDGAVDVEGRATQEEEEEDKNKGQGVSSSMWWRGPLRRWRLQDSTVYS